MDTNDMNDIMLPPDPARVMEGLRDTGYDFNTAIADIIDNSIAANATLVDILIDADPSGEVFVYIADNGSGMDFVGLKNAMKYGSSERDDPASLGKFGLGLKTASTAFCRSLSVVSKGADLTARKVQWDLDYIAQTRQWKLRQPEITPDEVEFLQTTAGDGTGTLVIWEKVDRIGRNGKRTTKAALKKTISALESHIAMVYQRFLDKADTRAANVVIKLNGKAVEPWDPFCITEPKTIEAYHDELSIGVEGTKVEEDALLIIRAYVIPRKDEYSSKAAEIRAQVSNDRQGFYIYRENRLIHFGDWMGMLKNEPHGTLLRVELSFDYKLDEAFHVDIKKSRILLNEDLFNYIKDQVIPAPRRAAEDRYRKGTQSTVRKAGEDAHNASNQNIDDKAKGVEAAKVEVDPKTNETQLTNANGTFKHRITIRSADKPGQYRVVPVDGLENGILWEPSLVDGRHAVQINRNHPYYQKIYYPVLSQNVMVTGMDALLWSLAEAELATFNSDTKEQYEEMRIQVSRVLKRLLADLPDPDPFAVEDDED